MKNEIQMKTIVILFLVGLFLTLISSVILFYMIFQPEVFNLNWIAFGNIGGIIGFFLFIGIILIVMAVNLFLNKKK